MLPVERELWAHSLNWLPRWFNAPTEVVPPWATLGSMWFLLWILSVCNLTKVGRTGLDDPCLLRSSDGFTFGYFVSSKSLKEQSSQRVINGTSWRTDLRFGCHHSSSSDSRSSSSRPAQECVGCLPVPGLFYLTWHPSGSFVLPEMTGWFH